MTSTSPTRRPIEFRNISIGTTVAMLGETRPDLLADALHKMLGGRPDFFAGEATILDFSNLTARPERVDWAGLLSLFRRFQLQPIGARALPAEFIETARRAGIALLDDVGEIGREAPPPERPVRAAPPPPPPQPATPAATTMFIERPVRSGQQIYAQGGDLVLLAGMSSGSEVIADGSIHCYGPLRGRALAGAQGNERVRILATNFGPEIVAIAGKIGRAQSELQSRPHLVCRLLLEKKKNIMKIFSLRFAFMVSWNLLDNLAFLFILSFLLLSLLIMFITSRFYMSFSLCTQLHCRKF